MQQVEGSVSAPIKYIYSWSGSLKYVTGRRKHFRHKVYIFLISITSVLIRIRSRVDLARPSRSSHVRLSVCPYMFLLRITSRVDLAMSITSRVDLAMSACPPSGWTLRSRKLWPRRSSHVRLSVFLYESI